VPAASASTAADLADVADQLTVDVGLDLVGEEPSRGPAGQVRPALAGAEQLTSPTAGLSTRADVFEVEISSMSPARLRSVLSPERFEAFERSDVVIIHDPQPWDSLRSYVERADTYVCSRESFRWAGLDPGRIAMIAPSIDVFSPKNRARPVIASRIGGIHSQIVLDDPQHAEQLGENARARVRPQFTSPRSLLDYLGLIQRVVRRSRVRAAA
jgi:hypothetical protein